MISKNKIKYIRSLENKKIRDQLNLYVAEGPKVVGDILKQGNSRLKLILATKEWLVNMGHCCLEYTDCEVIEVNQHELSKVSFLCHPQQVLAVFQKKHIIPNITELETKLSLVLDGVQDPGNLGTIIRIADWFGIENIICSPDTVDVYNPKVIQSTMGSIARVNILYSNLRDLITSMPLGFPVYGTLLEGQDIYEQCLNDVGFILMGNEGKGISADIRELVNKALRIPNYPENRPTADSLNVAIATAIVCAEFRRRSIH